VRWPLPLAAAILLTAACQTPSPQPSVVFDESLDEFFSIHDPGALGYSRAAAALVRAGYSVTANRAPLARTLAGLADPRRAALVVGSRLGTTLGSTALTALQAFLARGGTLVLFAEHDNAYGNATALDELVGEFGIRIRTDRLQATLDPRLSPGPITIAASHLTRGDSNWRPPHQDHSLGRSADLDVRRGSDDDDYAAAVQAIWEVRLHHRLGDERSSNNHVHASF